MAPHDRAHTSSGQSARGTSLMAGDTRQYSGNSFFGTRIEATARSVCSCRHAYGSVQMSGGSLEGAANSARDGLLSGDEPQRNSRRLEPASRNDEGSHSDGNDAVAEMSQTVWGRRMKHLQ